MEYEKIQTPLPERDKPVRAGLIHTGKSFGEQIDYFYVKPDGGTPQASVDAFRKVYGDQPKRLRCMYVFPDARETIDSAFVRVMRGMGLVRRCNGETMVEKVQGEWQKGECRCKAQGKVPGSADSPCFAEYTVTIALPDLPASGLWTLSTRSQIGIENIVAHARMKEAMLGDLRGVEFDLVRRATKIGKATHHILAIEDVEGQTLREILLARTLDRPLPIRPATNALASGLKAAVEEQYRELDDETKGILRAACKARGIRSLSEEFGDRCLDLKKLIQDEFMAEILDAEIVA